MVLPTRYLTWGVLGHRGIMLTGGMNKEVKADNPIDRDINNYVRSKHREEYKYNAIR